MKYATIIPDTESEYRIIEDYHYDSTIDYMDAISCSSLSRDFVNTIHLIASESGEWVDFLSHPMLWPICSKLFIDQVSIYVSPYIIQIIPVEIFSRIGIIINEDYSLLNPLIQVDCLDYQRSNVLWSPETIYTNRYIRHIGNMTLIENNIPDNAAIFRVTGALSSLIVREDVIESLEEANCTGYRLGWVKTG